MTLPKPDYQPCNLVTITGSFLTPNGTFSPDPALALTAERWWMQQEQSRINLATVIIRAA